MHTLRRFALAFSLVSVACGDRQGADAGGETGGTMVVAVPGAGTSPIIPTHAADAMARLVADNVYERLAEIGPELNTVGDRGFTPRLAQRWEWAADSLSLAFHLDPRARWHDGTPVRANDVKFTLGVLKDPKTATQYTSFLTNVDSISVRDSLTAVAWFHSRSPEQFYQVAYQLYVLPEHILKDIPHDQIATSPAVSRAIGSGRFRLARLDPGVRVELVADTAHYRGRAKLDRVVLSFTPDANGAVTQLFSGQADMLDIVPPDVVPRLDSAPNLRAAPYSGLAYGFLILNTRNPILSDRNVRRALSMAVDRQGMLRNVYGVHGVLGSGPFPKALADTAVKVPPFDRAAAAALLDSAGWRMGRDSVRAKNGRPLAFAITVPTSSAARMRYAVLLQEQLKSVGAKVDIQSMDFNAAQQRLETGKFDAALNVVQQDPARSAARQYWTSAGYPPHGANYGNYSNPAVDALIDSLARVGSPDAKASQWRRAMQMVADDAPAIWLYQLSPVSGVHKRIHMEGVRADGWWHGLADWWIPANERIERDRIGLRPAQP